jgi:hypothetical protein
LEPVGHVLAGRIPSGKLSGNGLQRGLNAIEPCCYVRKRASHIGEELGQFRRCFRERTDRQHKDRERDPCGCRSCELLHGRECTIPEPYRHGSSSPVRRASVQPPESFPKAEGTKTLALVPLKEHSRPAFGIGLRRHLGTAAEHCDCCSQQAGQQHAVEAGLGSG